MTLDPTSSELPGGTTARSIWTPPMNTPLRLSRSSTRTPSSTGLSSMWNWDTVWSSSWTSAVSARPTITRGLLITVEYVSPFALVLVTRSEASRSCRAVLLRTRRSVGVSSDMATCYVSHPAVSIWLSAGAQSGGVGEWSAR